MTIPVWLTWTNIVGGSLALFGAISVGAGALSKLPFWSPVWKLRLEHLGLMAGKAVAAEKALVVAVTTSAVIVSADVASKAPAAPEGSIK